MSTFTFAGALAGFTVTAYAILRAAGLQPRRKP